MGLAPDLNHVADGDESVVTTFLWSVDLDFFFNAEYKRALMQELTKISEVPGNA